jgi:glycosyltransferase involved in cell wall biosynthesis
MIILFVTQNFKVGGLEQVVMDIAMLANKNGHKSIITYAGEIVESTREDVERAGIEHLRLPESRAERLALLRKHRINLVNAHYATILAHECQELGIPFMQTIHNMYLWFDETATTTWRELDAYTSRYIAVSSKAAMVAVQRLGLPEEKIAIVPNGVAAVDWKPEALPERDYILRTELGIPAESIVFVQVASFYPAKAQWITIEAFAEARKIRKDIYLLLLGKEVDIAYSKRVHEKIKTHAITEYVLMPGYRRDVPRFFNLARAALAPSFVEGWSLAISEATQLGVPVIATDVGGACEQLQGTDGILLPALIEDMAELDAEKYLSLLTDEELHKNMVPLLTQAVLDMASRPIRPPRPSSRGTVRRPEDAYTEHLEIMRNLTQQISPLR